MTEAVAVAVGGTPVGEAEYWVRYVQTVTNTNTSYRIDFTAEVYDVTFPNIPIANSDVFWPYGPEAIEGTGGVGGTYNYYSQRCNPSTHSWRALTANASPGSCQIYVVIYGNWYVVGCTLVGVQYPLFTPPPPPEPTHVIPVFNRTLQSSVTTQTGQYTGMIENIYSFDITNSGYGIDNEPYTLAIAANNGASYQLLSSDDWCTTSKTWTVKVTLPLFGDEDVLVNTMITSQNHGQCFAYNNFNITKQRIPDVVTYVRSTSPGAYGRLKHTITMVNPNPKTRIWWGENLSYGWEPTGSGMYVADGNTVSYDPLPTDPEHIWCLIFGRVPPCETQDYGHPFCLHFGEATS